MPPLGKPQVLRNAVDGGGTGADSYGERSFARAVEDRLSFVGSWNVLVILIDFPDYSWKHGADDNFSNVDSLYTPAHFEEMLFSLGTYRDPFSPRSYTGSMRDFYLENSYGQFDLRGIVTKWYTAQHNLSYYADGEAGFGTYPNSSGRLVEEALSLADVDVDFSEFDNNQDGWVDGIFVVHAGPGAEEIYTMNYAAHQNYLWSHRSGVSAARYDNVRISGYTLEPENGTIGVFCHEFGHELGLPDLYDTDNSSEGIGEWGLMGAGGWCHNAGDQPGSSPAHFSAWSKIQLGWLEAINVAQNMNGVEIPPVELEPVVYRLWQDGRQEREYFLIENRQQVGFDQGLTRRQKDFRLSDPNGLIVYHIDELGTQSNERRRVVDVEEASPFFSEQGAFEQLDATRDLPAYEYLFSGNRGDNGDPFPGFVAVNEENNDFSGQRLADVFDGDSTPGSHSNDGFPTGVAITGVRLQGQNVLANLTVGITTEVASTHVDTPHDFVLQQNYPNPFNPETMIRFSVPQFRDFRLEVVNFLGEIVRVFTGRGGSGGQTIVWDGKDRNGRDVSSGVYFYRLTSADFSFSRKMLLVR
jgi:immune inhibitor A